MQKLIDVLGQGNMVRKTRMTEEQMWDKVRRAATSIDKHRVRIDQAGWERVRRTAANKTGWDQGEVDEWAAKEIEGGRLVINKKGQDSTTGS